MGNSKRPEGSVAKGKKEKKNIKAQTVADAGATARGAIAITRNGLEAANGIHVRALKQRDASRAEAAEVKSSLGAVSRQMHDQTMECSPTDQPVRNFKDSLGINITIKPCLLSGQFYFGTRTAVQAWNGVSAALIHSFIHYKLP